jgi:hypothetical protein
MKLLKQFLLAALFSTALFSCTDDEDDAVVTPPSSTADLTQPNVTRTTNATAFTEPSGDILIGDVKTNTVLKTGKTYTLRGFVYVLDGATLRIEPGVTIKGDKVTKGTLIITRNGKIEANGSATQPIVFTSNQTTPNIGDWGGIIILGNASNNGAFSGTNGLMEIEGGVNDSRGVGLHGGNKDDDNSGVFRYARIEFAGIAFQPDNEINTLTMGSVGSGTTIEYVQASYGGDDSFEWFGGTVNCKYLIAYRGTDDDFDTDFGFRGRIQFGISIRDTAIADFAVGGTSNSFESDNDAGGSTRTPQTAPVFSNMTLIGPFAYATASAGVATPFNRGAHIRRNSACNMFNSAVIGWRTGTRLEGEGTLGNANSNLLEFKNNHYAGNVVQADQSGAMAGGPLASFNTIAWLGTVGWGHTTAALSTGVLTNLNYLTPDPRPAAGSALLAGASFSSSKLTNSFFTQTTYRGAVGASDTWFQGWTRFFNR